MKQIVVIGVDRPSNPDSIKDLRGVYKRGDVYGIYEGGADLGSKVIAPRFLILEISDQAEAQFVKYTVPDVDGVIDPIEDPADKVIRRRLFSIDLDQLPPPVRDALDTTGRATVSWGQLRSQMVNKKTGKRETGKPLD